MNNACAFHPRPKHLSMPQQAGDLTTIPPIAVGGVGGSGTRVIAQLLMHLGFYLGDDLNDPNDNLWYTLLFKRIDLLHAPQDQFVQAAELFRNAMLLRQPWTQQQIDAIDRIAAIKNPLHSTNWLQQRAQSLKNAVATKHHTSTPWGWKEPNTHVFLDHILPLFPGMKYIHVMRSGLDMAYSSNQNQLRMWGPHFLQTHTIEINPHYSLKYWCAAHRRVNQLGSQLGHHFLLLNFDLLCKQPQQQIQTLLNFIDCPVTKSQLNDLADLIKPPQSIGRYKTHSLDDFDPDDIAYVRSLGFDT